MENFELFEKFFNDDAARIGLFWFSQDYAKIIKIEGELKITMYSEFGSARIVL